MSETCGITIDDSAIKRIAQLRASGVFGPQTRLRVAVEGGGCSGFQYKMEPDETVNEDDLLFGNDVVIDIASAEIMTNSTIKFQDDLMSAMFIVDNPNATSSCGCQTSFAIDFDKIG